MKALLERRGLRIEDFDVAIAAHALANRCTLVTDNLKHMATVPGLLIEDWSSTLVMAHLGTEPLACGVL